MAKEHHVSLQSPLSELIKPGALKQEPLPTLPAPHDTSPISIRRLAFILHRPVAIIQTFKDRIGRRWHSLTTDHKASGFSSSLSFRFVDGKKEATTTQTIRGETLSLTQDGTYAVLTNEHGAYIRYNTAGSGAGSHTPARRQRELAAQVDIPWYQKTAEAVGTAGIRVQDIEAEIIDAPDKPGITANSKPVARFKLKLVDIPEPVELVADVYNDANRDRGGNPYRIQQTLYKKLKAGERVVFTGIYHVDRTLLHTGTTVKPFERRWVRLMHIDRKN